VPDAFEEPTSSSEAERRIKILAGELRDIEAQLGTDTPPRPMTPEMRGRWRADANAAHRHKTAEYRQLRAWLNQQRRTQAGPGQATLDELFGAQRRVADVYRHAVAWALDPTEQRAEELRAAVRDAEGLGE